jgi:hypothetical protein
MAFKLLLTGLDPASTLSHPAQKLAEHCPRVGQDSDADAGRLPRAKVLPAAWAEQREEGEAEGIHPRHDYR